MSSTDQPTSSSAEANPAADAEAPEETITFTVKAINDTKITTTVSKFISVADLKKKLAEEANIPADRQRLIYSGRVLKDDQTVDNYKIQNGHTVHLVRAAASNTTAATGQPATGATASGNTAGNTPARPAVPSMAAGTGSNPIARFANHVQLPSADMFGPDGGMGPPPNTEDMLRMMEQPGFRSTMNQLLQNPTMLDHLIQSNPMLQQMPGARQMMQSEEFRNMMTDPNVLRQMTQMQQMFGMGPFGRGMGGAGRGAGSFPAPGVTDQTPGTTGNTAGGATATSGSGAPGSTEGGSNPASPPPNPFAALFGAGGGAAAGGGSAEGGASAANPFGGLFGNPAFLQAAAASAAARNAAAAGEQTGSEGGAGAGGNPFMPPNLDINQFQQMMQMLGGGGGFGAPAAPTDTRPIEERYADQLRQLNDMGFFDFDRNCEALRRSGGSVQGAVEYLLNQP